MSVWSMIFELDVMRVWSIDMLGCNDNLVEMYLNRNYEIKLDGFIIPVNLNFVL
jgi:hypothetical protein